MTTKETWTLDEIEVEVTGFFTTHHTLETDKGSLGKFTFPAFSQHGVYHAPDERELLMQKAHWLGTAHELIEGETVRGTADKAGLFRRDLDITFEDRTYSLAPEGAFKQGWLLLDAAGNTLAEFQPRGIFKQGAYISIWGYIDADLVAFAYYLVHMQKQEEAAVVAATSAS